MGITHKCGNLEEVSPRDRGINVKGLRWEKGNCKAQQVAPGREWCGGGMKSESQRQVTWGLAGQREGVVLPLNMRGNHRL